MKASEKGHLADALSWFHSPLPEARQTALILIDSLGPIRAAQAVRILACRGLLDSDADTILARAEAIDWGGYPPDRAKR